MTLSAAFDETLAEPVVKPQARDRWMVSPPPIVVTDERETGGHWELLVTPRGPGFTGIMFDALVGFGLNADEAVTSIRTAPGQQAWIRPNETVRIASGETTGPTANIAIRAAILVHAPSGEPPAEFALEMLVVEALPGEA